MKKSQKRGSAATDLRGRKTMKKRKTEPTAASLRSGFYTSSVQIPIKDDAIERKSEALSQQIPGIPEDLLVEILSWLPVKSLLRFKCVSKYWHALVSSPHLIKSHLEKATNNESYTHHRLLLTFGHCHSHGNCKCKLKQSPLGSALSASPSITELATIPYPMKISGYPTPAIVGSCNGLVCITLSAYRVLLWNPALRKFKKLVPSFGPKPARDRVLRSYMKYGFGYVKSSDDYKVVVISTVEYHGSSVHPEVRAKIYSTRTDSWRRLPEEFEVAGVYLHGCLANGKLHWIVTPVLGSNRTPTSPEEEIISLDLSRETFQVVEPPQFGQDLWDWDLQVLGGELLTLFCYYRSGHLDMWIMKEYGVKESWTKMVLLPDWRDDSRFGIYCSTIFLSKDGEILLKIGSKYAVYNPKHGSIIYPETTDLYYNSEAVVYAESLVMPVRSDNVDIQGTTTSRNQDQIADKLPSWDGGFRASKPTRSSPSLDQLKGIGGPMTRSRAKKMEEVLTTHQ